MLRDLIIDDDDDVPPAASKSSRQSPVPAGRKAAERAAPVPEPDFAMYQDEPKSQLGGTVVFPIPIYNAKTPQTVGRVNEVSEKEILAVGVSCRKGDAGVFVVKPEAFGPIKTFKFAARCQWVKDETGENVAALKITQMADTDKEQLGKGYRDAHHLTRRNRLGSLSGRGLIQYVLRPAGWQQKQHAYEFNGYESQGNTNGSGTLCVGEAATALLDLSGLDLALAGLWYLKGGANNGWIYGRQQPWAALFDFGNIPTLVLAFGALLVYARKTLRGHETMVTKACLVVILTVVLGPGLIVNGILKPHWGRHRPREITAFGGTADYRRAWEPTLSDKGHSFTCGHCSMAFAVSSGVAFYPVSPLLGVGTLVGGLVLRCRHEHSQNCARRALPLRRHLVRRNCAHADFRSLLPCVQNTQNARPVSPLIIGGQD